MSWRGRIRKRTKHAVPQLSPHRGTWRTFELDESARDDSLADSASHEDQVAVEVLVKSTGSRCSGSRTSSVLNQVDRTFASRLSPVQIKPSTILLGPVCTVNVSDRCPRSTSRRTCVWFFAVHDNPAVVNWNSSIEVITSPGAIPVVAAGLVWATSAIVAVVSVKHHSATGIVSSPCSCVHRGRCGNA